MGLYIVMIMTFDSYRSIQSLTPQFLEAVVQQSGVPDNFVDSAEGSLVGMPDIDTDPQCRELKERLDKTIADLGAEATKNAI